jgi:hypothetical protein
MGSQAHRLLGCSFHPSGFAPEGGAPAQADGASIAVGRGELEDHRSSGAYPVQVRACCSPWERLTTEPANTLQLAKVQAVH